MSVDLRRRHGVRLLRMKPNKAYLSYQFSNEFY